MLLALSVFVLLIWLGLLFCWHGYWRVSPVLELETTGETANGDLPSVAIIVPARNEAQTIPTSLRSLMAQEYQGKVRLYLVNDSSTDDTSKIARQLAKGNSEGISLTVIDAPEKATGWAGKMWALKTGVEQAQKAAPDCFWFTDADITHSPDTLSRLTSVRKNAGAALVSTMVKLRCQSFWEKLLIPAFVYCFGLIYPFRAVNSPTSRIAGAAGGSILIDREALEKIGGIEAVRDAIIDDCTLGKEVKRAGFKLWLGHSANSKSIRDYPSLPDIREMVVRSAYTQLNYSPFLLCGAMIGLVITFILPWLLLLAGGLVTVIAAFTIFLMTVSYFPIIRFYKLSPIWALRLTEAMILFGSMTVQSAFRHHFGRANSWRGRRLD